MKKVDSVFDESVISDDNTQEICNEHNVTEINYQKGRRMVLQVIMVIGLIGHSWGHLDSSSHVYPHLAI